MMASCSKPAKELAEKGESTMTPNWLALPRDVTANILQRLDTFEIVTSVCRVCPLWWKICKDPFMWRTVHMNNNYGNSSYNSEKVCRYAIDRSYGQLEDINIQNFGSDDLLNYIADSAGQLKRLRLANCVDISDKALCQVAMKLPLLEELGLSHIDYLSKDSLEAFGRSCPLLKVFKLNMPLVTFFTVDNVNDGVLLFQKPCLSYTTF
ncbi:Leucine-rich repeat, cysteine-containing subtype [Sesbania bispinosa]|nr:Leucine-rich repeat, cysteine-containing subtype [Sesbania bispinosa]